MKRVYLFIWTLALLALSGCGNGKDSDKMGNYIYYVNTNGTDLVKMEYYGDMTAGEASVEEMLAALKYPEEELEGQSPFTGDVSVMEFELAEQQLTLHFNEAYRSISVVEEVLLRSAAVQSLTRIEGVEAVSFCIGEEPLADNDGRTYGFMRADDFIQNTGSAINSYQKQELVLYFTDESGTRLVKETNNVRYNSNTAMEKVIVERVMKGPAEAGHYPTIPPEAKLLGVSVKDEICYVNFDEGIQQAVYDLKPEIPIYSIVNSLIENGIAEQVQISISGETTVKFRNSVNIEQPFAADWELAD